MAQILRTAAENNQMGGINNGKIIDIASRDQFGMFWLFLYVLAYRR